MTQASEINKNNSLSIFRHEVKAYLHRLNDRSASQQNYQQQIQSYQQLIKLLNHLCDQKLLHPNEIKKILSKIDPINDKTDKQKNKIGNSSSVNQNQINDQRQDKKKKKKTIIFPFSVKQLENLIMVQFSDQNCKNLLIDLKKFQTLLKQVKGVLNVWKDKGLTNQEKSELESIFAKGNQKISHLCRQLKKKQQVLQNISQQQIQMIKSLDQWVQMQQIEQKFQDYQDFQKHNKKVINTLFNKKQVKQAHFKKKQSNISINFDILKVKGFDSKNDQPIQVVLISKSSINFPKINKQIIKFDALKQLSLSQYFPNFLGFNTHSSQTSIQYFVQTFQSKNLATLMNTQKSLDLQSPLLKYWIYQIYRSFYDIFSMCSYKPQLPIKVENFQVKDFGLQLVLKNIDFTEKRKRFQGKIDPLQTSLLHNLSLVLLNLLNVHPSPSQIDKNFTKFQQKCFFKSLLNVVESHNNYEELIVQNRLSFFNLQTHPLLQQSQFSEGQQIVENYIAVFGLE